MKNEFTEDEKYHNLMTWLKHSYSSGVACTCSVCLSLCEFLAKILMNGKSIDTKTECNKGCLGLVLRIESVHDVLCQNGSNAGLWYHRSDSLCKLSLWRGVIRRLVNLYRNVML